MTTAASRTDQESAETHGRMADQSVLERILERIDARTLWLASRMIHEANVVRPSPDGLKVGGHQASSASSVSILTELYLRYLRPHDILAPKPHAAPVVHSLLSLMGVIPSDELAHLRVFGGLQSYLSRTKDQFPVDISLGSMGLGPAAPLFLGLADRYLRDHFDQARDLPPRRFVAMVGDAEMDEGNIWEAIGDETLRGLGQVTWIVDLNRQSLDRVIPGIRVRQLESTFIGAGWQVLEAKYGRRLQERFDMDGGGVLRDGIDSMTNEEYQATIRRSGADARAHMLERVGAEDRVVLERILDDVTDDALPGLLADLGGHDHEALADVLAQADADTTRPSVIFAYTIKGWRLPFAGDALNHAAQLNAKQIEALAPTLGADADDPWAGFAEESPEGELLHSRARELFGVADDSDARGGQRPSSRSAAHGRAVRQASMPTFELDPRIPDRTSTQAAFGDVLAEAARQPELVERMVTTSADVSVSTNLGGWINRVGVYDPEAKPVFDETPRLLRWQPNPEGRHIELGISEMNLFMMLGQLGLTGELLGEPLIPIGTVYDPFIARGLDALIFSLYNESRFILVATPSGVSLAPEGGAHQSTITPSIGIELPNLHAFEPAFAREVAWCLEEGIAGCVGARSGFSTYLRLTTRPVEQSLAAPVSDRLGEVEWRRQVLAGGYLMLIGRDLAPELAGDAPRVTIVASGAVVTEAVEAVRFLVDEEVDANLVVVTSADRLAAQMHEGRLSAMRGQAAAERGHLEVLFPESHRRTPMVTVMDGASHTLSFLGGAFGAPVVPLGTDKFGQSGTIPDLYAYMGIDTEHIVESALLAIDSPTP